MSCSQRQQKPAGIGHDGRHGGGYRQPPPDGDARKEAADGNGDRVCGVFLFATATTRGKPIGDRGGRHGGQAGDRRPKAQRGSQPTRGSGGGHQGHLGNLSHLGQPRSAVCVKKKVMAATPASVAHRHGQSVRVGGNDHIGGARCRD